MRKQPWFRALALLSFLGVGVEAGTYKCTEPVTAYDPADPIAVLGIFTTGSILELGEKVKEQNLIAVTYKDPKGGAPIKAVCYTDAQGNPVGTITPGEWTTNFAKALRTAAAMKRSVLMDFTGSDWCPWCVKLEQDVFEKPEFKEFARKNLVLVKVDFPRKTQLPEDVARQNEELQAKYGITGFPSALVVNPKGEVIGSRMGYYQGDPLKTFLGEVEKRLKAQQTPR